MEDETTRSPLVNATPSATDSAASLESENHEQVARMVTKLFSMYPVSRNQNLDLAIEGYVEVLRSLPWRWVSVAIRALSEDPDLTFAPPVGKIRAETARQYRRAWRSQRGKDPDRDELGHPLALNDPDRWLLEARARAGLPILVDRPLVQRLEALVERFEVE